MDLSLVKKLIKMVETSQIDELEIKEDDFQIRVTKSHSAQGMVQPQPLVQAPIAPAPASAPAVSGTPTESVSVPDNVIEIKSPMVGTLYHSSSPDATPYVKEGDTVKQGQVLCIIEAMKLMNEIEAEIGGKIVKVLVQNAQPVEYDQVLFWVEKI